MADYEVVWSDYVFEGKLINVRMDSIRQPNGELKDREVVEHPGAVAIIPVLSDGRIVLVRQHRPAVKRSLLELPAGTVELGEDATDTAVRELQEETGYRTESMSELLRFFVSPGWCDEEIQIFAAENITAGAQSPEDDEEIDVEVVEPDSISRLISQGEIADAKTITGLIAWLGIRMRPE
jgi:ADP-ribose pyrophosphatase